MDRMIIDKDHNLPPISEVCFFCRHLYSPGVDRKCKAFPKGIPVEIWVGDNPHTEPLPDQGNDYFFLKK